ncbi:MAG: tetratricopeptide repeat protein [Rikenellaceae bacterium]|nr:tetratricopeptide repeat protein [Rikenellaceae bacterium]
MRRLALYLLAAVVALCGIFMPQSTVARTSKPLKLYTDAVKRLTIYGDTVSAVRLTNEALKADSNYMPASYLLARIESNPEVAWRAAERAVRADSTNHHLLQEAAERSLRAKKYSRAMHYLQTLVKRGDDPDHFRLLAILHMMTKESDKAIAVLDSAEVRLGKIEFFSRMRQQIYLESGDNKKALNSAVELVNEAPYDPANHISLADVYAAMDADSLADVTYNTAINLDKTNSDSWFSYASFLDRRKRHTEMLLVWRNIIDLQSVPLSSKIAIVESVTSKRDFYRKNFLLIEPIITRLYQLHPENSSVTDLYISHLIAGNRVDEALLLLKGRLDPVKPDEQELGRIISIEQHLGRLDSVAVYADLGIHHYPTTEDFWNLKAWLQMRKNDNRGAIQTLRAALEYAKDSKAKSSLWGNIGDQYHELGETKKSYSAYYKALSFNPQNAMVLNNFAYHLSVTGKSLKQALQMAQKATTLSPNNATYLDTLAWVYYKLERYDEAKKVMQQAMSFDTDNSAELALHYGDILDALGSTFLAQTYWRKALERGADAEKIESRIEAQKARIAAQKAVK